MSKPDPLDELEPLPEDTELEADQPVQERFILNVNDGVDTVHDTKHLTENCNSDDIVGRQYVDVRTAAQMIASGQAEACAYCNPRADHDEP